MFKNVVPISTKNHSDIKVIQMDSYAFAKNTHIASVMLQEFPKAALVYPIVFIEDKSVSEFKPVVLLGLQDNENLFVDEDNRWNAQYIPAIIRRYPFALASTNDENQFTICIDEESELVSKTEGVPLFDEKGKPTELMQNIKSYLTNLQQMEILTRELSNIFKEKDLLAPLELKLRIGENMKNIEGLFSINEEKLNALPDEDFLTFKKQNVLVLIYSHIISVAQMENLIKRKEKLLMSKPKKEIEEKVKSKDNTSEKKATSKSLAQKTQSKIADRKDKSDTPLKKEKK